MTIKVKVTRAGFTSCPSCLSHIRVESDLSEVECPFCGEALAVSIQGTIGQSTMSVLRKSRSGLVAAALAGLMFTACNDEDDKNDNNANNTVDMEADFIEEPINNQDYAGGPNNINNFNIGTNNLNNVEDMNLNNVEDMGNSDMSADG